MSASNQNLPNEIVELMGQLVLINLAVSRMADEANDAWCESPEWSPLETEWCQRVDETLREITEQTIALIQHGRAL